MGTLRQIMKVKLAEGVKKLPEGFKNKWIEALRSDRYEQAFGLLFETKWDEEEENEIEVGYCCLGVAAHVCEVGREHLKNRGTLYGAGKGNEWNHYRRRIPKALSDNTELQELLIQFNDGYQLPDGSKVSFNFRQIATWIEKYL